MEVNQLINDARMMDLKMTFGNHENNNEYRQKSPLMVMWES